ncbi:MAG: response regulator [Patescibacteria group bacterium]
MELVKNGLHFAQSNDGYVCRELAELPQAFEAKWTPEQIEEGIRLAQAAVIDHVEIDCASKEEHDRLTKDERRSRGAEAARRIVADIKTEGLSPFERFVFWCGDDWWYYNPQLRQAVYCDVCEIGEPQRKVLNDYVVPALPEAILGTVRGMDVINVCASFGHFAILLADRSNSIRRIVTDTRLYELRGVYGYPYLDLLPDGRPVMRCCCDRGGERAFFDGERLMSHDMFQTCAPKTVLIEGGYKFNSTRCSVVNGLLFDLIDADDKVAHSTGAWCFFGQPMVSWSKEDALESLRLAAESGARLRFNSGKVSHDGKELKPLGMFAPSATRLLDTGFTLYDWSDFHEVRALRYEHVLVVDDSEQWIAAVRSELGAEVPRLETFQTASAKKALARILKESPDAVMLDMHLTPDEKFDGLWVANQLAAQGFKGYVLITSNYGDQALKAMQVLIKMPVAIPGKNIQRVREVLYSDR